MSFLQSAVKRYSATHEPVRTLRRLELAALVLALLLLVQVAYGVFGLSVTYVPSPIEPAADTLRLPEVTDRNAPSIESRNALLDRPLFWASRSPIQVVTKTTSEKKEVGELDKVKLVGIFGSGSHSGVIALVEKSERRIRVGEEVSGWKLKSIGPEGARFVNGKRRQQLRLERATIEYAAEPPAALERTIGRKITPYDATLMDVGEDSESARTRVQRVDGGSAQSDTAN